MLQNIHCLKFVQSSTNHLPSLICRPQHHYVIS